VGRRELVVDLYRVAKLERGFLKLRLVQILIAVRYVIGFSFCGIGAAGKGTRDC
jgi:hypothetical protein